MASSGPPTLPSPASDPLSSLKRKQLNSVTRMLALNNVASNSPGSTANTSTGAEASSVDIGSYNMLPRGPPAQNQWKILIYDKTCRSIISPLLSVSDLRRRGVTLHLLLDSEREPIPDVPAVYFVEPTRSNLSIIAQDCALGLYKAAYLNFVTRLDRSLLEEFARLVVQSNSVEKVALVFDQYLDYVCLERNLFTLNKTNSYVLYNDPTTTEHMMERAMLDVANGLLSVISTIGQLPVIRCAKGGAPEMVARKLMKMISDRPMIFDRHKGRAGAASASAAAHRRPLMVIMDRNTDLITPVQHTSTYQALIDDVLTHKGNRVEFESKTEDAAGRVKTMGKRFDLDADEDPFYSRHKFNPFPEAIESNGVELQNVTKKTEEIRSKAIGGGVSERESQSGAVVFDADASASAGTNDLATAVDSLPALIERKRQLEVHTSILQAVMTQVASRDIPQFYELESALATGSYKNDQSKAKRDVMELVTDATKGKVADKIRLIIVFCLATTAPGSDIDEVVCGMRDSLGNSAAGGGPSPRLAREDEEKLSQGLAAITYLKRLRSMNMITTMSDQLSAVESSYAGAGASGDMLSTLMKSATNQATGLLAKATERVSSMLGKIHKHHVTCVVENLINQKPGTEDDEYLYLDPRISSRGGEVNLSEVRQIARAPVGEVVAFVIGPGSYSEHANLNQQIDNVIYGCCELVSPEAFLKQLASLQ